MGFFDTLRTNLTSFVQEYTQFIELAILAVAVYLLLWRFSLRDRKQIESTFKLALLALFGIGISGFVAKLGLETITKVFMEGSILIGGGALIRLFGLFFFRLVLPLCRIEILSIIGDLVELVGYCAWIVMRLHEAGLNLSSIVTTSAVMTAVLAFSMQETLGNILGGLALQLDKSVRIGDWIEIDNVQGKVVNISWRYTAIETRKWETIIIPNNALMKGKFSVLGRRTNSPLQWRRSIYFEIGYDHHEGKVTTIVEQAVKGGHIKNVANDPQPSCVVNDFKDYSVRYSLRYWLTDLGADEATDGEVRDRIHAALRRAGIKIPYPLYEVHLTHEDERHEQSKRQRRHRERLEALRGVELFDVLLEEEIAELSELIAYNPFAKGDIITRQGETAHCLFIIASGEADVFLELPNERRLINTLQAGMIVGEMGLMTGDPRSATVVAKTECVAYRLDKANFQKILENRPELTQHISELLTKRRFALDALQTAINAETAAQQMANQQRNLQVKIRNFFGLE